MVFTGTAAQIESAFDTEIHAYRVNGEKHFANATEPSIPITLETVVHGILGLDDFHLNLPKAPFGEPAVGSNRIPSRPKGTLSDGTHVLAPDDIAKIYDITRLYQAGIDGSGERLVVIGQSDIDLADIASFRSGFGLPINVPQVILVPGSPDPGTSTGNMGEADLDIEWTGAVARNSTIIYVNALTESISKLYAIDQNLAPVLSQSYGNCEGVVAASDAATALSLAQQANAQGITVLTASGDSGAAGCDIAFNNPEASGGLAVSFPASIPEITAVGGTQFNEGSGNYWSTTNSPTGASALSYIPEMAWNESLQAAPGFSAGLAASGGGFSIFYSQPSWQVGPGVVPLNARAVPDVSLSAAGHDPYLVVSGGQPTAYEGTSVATPTFAGMIALLNQYERSNGQGNINPNLYRLAQTNIFHDITTGSNVVPCVIGTSDCTTGSFGYSAGIGYDPVTGLGSVDAYNLVTEWNAATPESRVILSCNPNPVNQQPPNSNGFVWAFTLTLTETAGVATSLTDFTVNGTSYPADIGNFFGGAVIPAHGVITASLGYKTLTVPATLVFGISGVDAGGRQWSQQVSVLFNGPQSTTPPPAIALSETQIQFAWTVGGAIPRRSRLQWVTLAAERSLGRLPRMLPGSARKPSIASLRSA